MQLLASKRKRLSSALFTNNDYDGDNENQNETTMYTFFVEKSLKLRGMRKVLLRLLNIILPTLKKVKLTLENKSTSRSSKVWII